MTSLHTLLALCVLSAVGCCFAQSSTTSAPAKAVDPWASIASGSTVIADAAGTNTTYHYRLIEPRAEAIADPNARVPLVVFLHGAGERGEDNRAQLTHFAGACATEEFQRRVPCYVLAMQCPNGESWATIKQVQSDGKAHWSLPFQEEPTRPLRAVMQAMDEVIAKTKAVDPSRIYLTGLSMGGFGSFDLAARRPELFAAVVPICGGGDPETAARFAKLPIYIVHGSDDPVVPVGLSRAMNEAIAAAANTVWREELRRESEATPQAPRPMPKRPPNPMYREYDKVGHDSWTSAYRFGEDGVLDWMFAQRRPSASAATNAPTVK